jgi:ADP-ribose pyrophosphatase YjhB (NUDIX family)
VLVGYPREHIWVLPKGTPGAGETTEQTALREVREETGVEVQVLGDLGSIEFWFARKNVRFHKEVVHYLMLAVGGDVSLHDHEYDEARWFPYDVALRQLTHANEAAVLQRAEPLIRQWLRTEKE